MTDNRAGVVIGATKRIDRKALVPGASNGIGAGIVKEPTERGAAVAVTYASSHEGA